MLVLFRPLFQKQAGNDVSRLIVIQCDSGHKNGELIACARYRIYDERAKALKKQEIQHTLGGVTHVLFVINLPHQVSNSSFVGFQGDPWVSYHIDELCPTSEDTVDPRRAISASISELFIGEYIDDIQLDLYSVPKPQQQKMSSDGSEDGSFEEQQSVFSSSVYSHPLEQQLHDESSEDESDEEEKNGESVVLQERSAEDTGEPLEKEFDANSDSEVISERGSFVDQEFHQHKDSKSPAEEMILLDFEGQAENGDILVTPSPGYEAIHKVRNESDLPSTKEESEPAALLPSLSTCDSDSEQEEEPSQDEDEEIDLSAVESTVLDQSPADEMILLDLEGQAENGDILVTPSPGYEAIHKVRNESDLPSTKEESEPAAPLPPLSTCDSDSEQEEEPSQDEDEEIDLSAVESTVLDQSAHDLEEQTVDMSDSFVDLSKFKYATTVNQRSIAQCKHLHTCIQAAASKINDTTKDRSTQRVTRLTKLIPRDPGKVIGKFDCTI